MSNAAIRDANEGDLETIVRFNKALARESENLELEDTVIRAGVLRAMRAPALCRYFVAEIDNHVVGQTMLTYELTDWRDGLVYWIQSVYVDPKFRGRGVFRRLYEHVHSVARAAGDARIIRLYVEKDNIAAKNVYEQLGMKPAHFDIFEVEPNGLTEFQG